jgi:serine/threonine protein kinase
MQALRLVQSNNFDLKYKLGNEIGYGADGQVFDLLDHEDWVIKISVLYDDLIIDNPKYNQIHNVLSNIAHGHYPMCARIFDHKYIGSGTEKAYIGKRHYILYYYVMEKLGKITEDEKKVFYSLLSHEDRNVKKNYSLASATDMLRGMQVGLDFDYTKVFRFYRTLQEHKFYHMDLHPRNIMKDSEGNFKLIDFDRVMIGD